MADGLPLREWFVMPDANTVARRHEVWTLLGWYHQKVVKPQLGFTGAFRRLWWILTGQSDRLLSPWEQVHRRVEYAKATKEQRQREAMRAELAAAAAAPEATNGHHGPELS